MAEDGTVGKALEVLDRVAGAARPLRFAEVQGLCPLPKATLHRLLSTLVSQGMLRQDNGTYAPGLRLVRLAHAAWEAAALAPLAAPVLDRLADRTGEAVHLAELDQGQVVYLDKRHAARPVTMFAQAGKVGPAYCTGIGKAMLAHLAPGPLETALARQSFHGFTPATIRDAGALRAELAAIRAEGVAYDREEHEPGIRCIAAPVLSDKGGLIAGLSVTSARLSLDELGGLAPLLRAAAAEIAAAAGPWRFPE
ncbi:MAG: IclR family transcriptional regulator [Paracoccaceae bacterium]